MKKSQVDMLGGSLLKNVLAFSIPVILTSLLQLFFNAADLIVVGRFCGSISVGAVGATGAITNLVINMFIGLSIGAGVLFSDESRSIEACRSCRKSLFRFLVPTSHPTAAVIIGIMYVPMKSSVLLVSITSFV